MYVLYMYVCLFLPIRKLVLFVEMKREKKIEVLKTVISLHIDDDDDDDEMCSPLLSLLFVILFLVRFRSCKTALS